MAARSIASLTLGFGLVSIPVKLYSATESSSTVRFNLLAKDGSRVKQQYVSERDGKVVERADMSIGPSAPAFDALLADFQAGKAIVVSTNDIEEKPLVEHHTYAVSNVYRDANGNQWVELYNPWGHDHPTLSFDEVRKRQIYIA